MLAAGRVLPLLVPEDPEALLDENAFARDEFMPYWAEVWPSGLALADALADVRPARVVELGCGVGIPSLIAALNGAQVIATDWADDAIELLRVNAERVGAELEARTWSWTDDPAGLQGDLVLAADVLYEARNAEPLIEALDAVVAPGGEAWVADPGRSSAPPFFERAKETWTLEPVAQGITRLRRDSGV